jgi:AcrR family transcriptional regulator
MTAATSPGATAPTARDRARAELTEEIKTVARRHLAEHGSAALSLRAVAREVGMVSSAVYRYFPSRDELLTALIVDAYDAVGRSAEEALAASAGSVVARWVGVSGAIRAWALAHPHEYALIYGSPVPGYAAPPDTIDPATRVAVALLQIVVDGVAAGEIGTDENAEVGRAVGSDFAQLRALAAPGVPDAVLSRALLAWSSLFGSISLEMFGHLHNVIHDYDAYFELQMRSVAEYLTSGHRG